MKNIFKRNFILALVFSLVIVIAPCLVYGAGLLPAESEGASCPQGQTGRCGNYTLNDGVQLMVNVSTWILGIVGSLALLMFVIGGFMFLISAGNSQTVEKGKKIIIGSVIGLIIVFCSYMIIQFSMSAMGLQWSGTTAVPTAITPPAPDECDSLASQGYSCMDKSGGKNCKTGFCASKPDNILCCQPN